MDVLDIGVVIAGAGARGAYEAGLLASLLPELAARSQNDGRRARFSFIGTSAGSLNAALIACRAPHVLPEHSPDQVRQLWAAAMGEVGDVWAGISESRVLGLLPSGRLIGAFTRLLPFGRLPLVSLLNVDPLVRLADDPSLIDWSGLAERIADRRVAVVGVAATARDGRTVIFLDRGGRGRPLPRDEGRDIDYVDCPDGLRGQHVLASSAIPCAFPAQRVDAPAAWAGWYYDGGVRLNTPLKPALELGFDHLVIVGTHPDTYDRDRLPDPDLPQPEIDEAAIPVANQLMADQLIQDLQTLRSRNRAGHGASVSYLFAGPPSFHTLADLAATSPTQWTVARALRGALSPAARDELSSFLLFDPGYLSASFAAGQDRAKSIGLDWRT